jgi:hypothetical protein
MLPAALAKLAEVENLTLLLTERRIEDFTPNTISAVVWQPVLPRET